MDALTSHFLRNDAPSRPLLGDFFKGVALIQPDGAAPLPALGEVYEQPTPTCHRCGLEGHVKSNCPQRDACNNCGEPGHKRADCPSIICSMCEQQGHLRSRCPNKAFVKQHMADAAKREKEAAKELPCVNCGSPEHALEYCTAEINDELKAEASAKEARKSDSKARASGRNAGRSDTNARASDKDAEAATELAADDLAAKDLATEDNPDLGEPITSLDLPTDAGLEVKLLVVKQDTHYSSLTVEFRASFLAGADDPSPSNTGADTNESPLLSHTSGGPRFTALNIRPGSIRVQELTADDLASDEMLQQLGRVTVQRLQSSLHMESNRPYRVDFVVQNTCLLGNCFYCNGNYGPFTEAIYGVRDALKVTANTRVSFFAVKDASLVDSIYAIADSIHEQATNDPVLAFHRNGKPNYQKGMQLRRELRPQSDTIAARYTFDSVDDYLTTLYLPLIEESELADEAPTRVETVLRAVRWVEAGENIYVAALQRTADLNPRVDSRLGVSLQGEDADGETDWTAIVVAPIPFISGHDIPVFLLRKRLPRGGGFEPEPAGFHDTAIDSSMFSDTGELAEALYTNPGVRVHVRERVPKVGTSRQINTLRFAAQSMDMFRPELTRLLCNQLGSGAPFNWMEQLTLEFGQTKVDAAIRLASTGLHPEGARVLDALRDMSPGGLLAVQGIGGTGKSELLAKICQLLYALNAPKGQGAKIWVQSPLNAQLTNLAPRITELLLDTYNLNPSGNKYPIVFIRHMRETENKVRSKEADELREARLQEEKEPRTVELDLDEVDVDELGLSWSIQQLYAKHDSTSFDRRVVDASYSEGTALNRMAGLKDRDGNMHPTARPEEFKVYRGLMEKYANGGKFSELEKRALVQSANAGYKLLASEADVVLMTADVVSQARTYSVDANPPIVLHDEAGKESETHSLAGLIWSKRPDTTTPQVFFGDLFQPRPSTRMGANSAFPHQAPVSLFARLIKAGVRSVTLRTQHRFVESITGLMNTVVPAMRALTSPEVPKREPSIRIHDVFRKLFRTDEPLVYIATNGTEERVGVTQSRYNIVNANKAMWVVLALLEAGVKAHEIGIGAFYTAQVNVYATALQLLEEWCFNQGPEGDYYRFAHDIQHITYFTIDGIQGGQVEVLVLDVSNTKDLGFVRDTARINLAIGRTRCGLVAVGNAHALHTAYATNKNYQLAGSAYQKMVSAIKTRGRYLNMQKPIHAGKRAPFDVSESLERIHAPCSVTDDPISFSLDGDDVPVGGPSFHADDDNTDDNDNGDGGWGGSDNGGSDNGGGDNGGGDNGDGDGGSWDGNGGSWDGNGGSWDGN